MSGSGTRTFADPDDFGAGLRQMQIELSLACGGGFKARLTWVELRHLELLRCKEEVPRIGYLSLPPRAACVSFPANPGPLPKWRSMELQAGDIMLHSLGERFHHVTQGPSIWSLIALDPAQLDDYSRILAEKPLALPATGRVLRPSPRDAARLRRCTRKPVAGP